MRENKIFIALISLLLVATLFTGCVSENTAAYTTTEGQEQYNDISVITTSDFWDEVESEKTTADKTTEDTTVGAEKTTAPKISTSKENKVAYRVKLDAIPAFSGKPYVTVNGNTPGLSENDRTAKYFEKYTPLDSIGRCGVAFACLGLETMPSEERGAIGSVKPSGWHTIKYDIVDGKYLYNRCHLIGFQLSGENANTQNLITGTRYMNVEGMLPFENMVADYIKETGNHVLYRVTPIFKGTELVCRGVQMEGYSVEDEGDGIFFNVFCYNSQPGVSIDYATGVSSLNNSFVATTKEEKTTHHYTTQKQETTKQTVSENNVMVWIPNSGSRYHNKSTCSNMKNPTKVTLQEAERLGFTPCGRCY